MSSALLLAFLAPALAHAQDEGLASRASLQPPIADDDGPRIERRPIGWLAISGLSLFGLVYVAGIPGTAAVSESAGSKFSGSHASVMAIPFAGPWMEASGTVERESSHGAPALIALGVLQIVGAAAGVVGLVGREEVVPPSDARNVPSPQIPPRRRPEAFVTATPTVSPAGAGLSLRGTL